ncbi:MAG TPA: ATP-binding protein [Chitinophagaceae bacterium]|nr:ATP-binding protein [Chitinophagaceae bacterium]
MTKGARLVIFLALAVLLVVIYWYFKGTIFPHDTIGLVIYSSLLMLSFNTLILEHYFTKPTDVLASSIAVLLTITPIKKDLLSLGGWYNALFFFSLTLGVLSVASLALFSPNKPEDITVNKISRLLKDFVVRFGSSKVQFFCLFVLTMFFYIDSKSQYFLFLFIYSAFVLLDPWKFIMKIPAFVSPKPQEGIGQIFGVQSKNTFLVKLYDQRPSIKIFDFVEFKYSIDGDKSVRKGLILDNYLLNQEQWVKVLVSDEIKGIFGDQIYHPCNDENIVFKISNPENNDYLDKFVGIVDENSVISTIRFIYNSQKEIFDGQLLEVFIRGKKVLYQVVQGVTKIETLEQKNETGYIVGEAIQLGIWNIEKGKFEKYGWLPFINSPVYLATNIIEPNIEVNEYKIGNIPNSNYPVILNKDLALSHHTAILGITGSGKSIFARNLIREYLKDDNVKVICVDFTLEYRGKFQDLNPKNIIADEHSEKLFKGFDWISTELEKFGNQQDKEGLKNAIKFVRETFTNSISTFLQSQDKISIFELPDVSNTSGVLEYTKAFFQNLFLIAKTEKCFGKKVCIVLEEAHTVVPEWNFLGISEKSSQSLVNNIGQIALQGRKYGIGFLVIAQRTANVSKTVLTQCNTIISFQEFDRTSSEFLSNYFGQTIAETLPNLKYRQAIAAGKGLKSNVPMIFEVPHIDEPG